MRRETLEARREHLVQASTRLRGALARDGSALALRVHRLRHTLRQWRQCLRLAGWLGAFTRRRCD